jgi:hypothetical protein
MADTFTARKLWCLDQILRDDRVSHLDFRFAYYIGTVTDRATGEARFKQDTAATALKVTRRSIQLSAERLRALGHIDVTVSPGRTHVNSYRLFLEKANGTSPLANEKVNGVAPIDQENENGVSPFNAGKGERRDHKRRKERHEKAKCHSHQSFPCLIPCLIPSRAREPAIDEALGSLGASLEARIGPDKARAWFGKTSSVDVCGDTLTLAAPSNFIADRIRTEFESDLIACCSRLVPAIKRARLTVSKAEAAA